MKILITGSKGFIGTNLIHYLATFGHQIVGIDNDSAGSINARYTSSVCSHFTGDLSDIDFVAKCMKDVDLVLHLAAKGNVIESINSPFENFNNNVASTVSLLEAMRVSGVNRIVFASTGGALMGIHCLL